MRPGAPSLKAAMGGHKPAPAAPADMDNFDAFLAKEAERLAGGKKDEAPAPEPEAPKPEPNPSVIVWAGAHGEQSPPEGIKWQSAGQMDAPGHGVLATTAVSALCGAFDLTVRAWRLRVPRHVSHDHFQALVERWFLEQGRDWIQCGAVIACGHPDLVLPLLKASVKCEGQPLIVPIRADEPMIDAWLRSGKVPRLMRSNYQRRWAARWET